ncbi:MAG TPA: hypothetical protein VMW42_01890, partial [Desulfatiglandales bacterium]|nr:hypothetical protein [Desulfatiglandales bacterium]
MKRWEKTVKSFSSKQFEELTEALNEELSPQQPFSAEENQRFLSNIFFTPEFYSKDKEHLGLAYEVVRIIKDVSENYIPDPSTPDTSKNLLDIYEPDPSTPAGPQALLDIPMNQEVKDIKSSYMKISIRHNAAEVKRVSMEKDEIEISERDRFAKDMADMASEPIDPAEVRKARRKHRLTAIAGEVK